MDLALSTLSLFAVNLALWSFADRVAHSWAHRVIALPSALRMAVTFDFSYSLKEIRLGDDGSEGQRSQQNEKERNSHDEQWRM